MQAVAKISNVIISPNIVGTYDLVIFAAGVYRQLTSRKGSDWVK